ncbi:esterase [Symmachiella macrocystis]|uniref:Esterase n=1 Tax=Symmachiella macrocystis TaxID=2527985 RepID=A0A5C6BQB6_9PLAN|nr:alpha/beta fold hydrolase [Symmachiella macrocystis]TWU13416.1 esterase [Symmachiella macrocystis]
MGKFSGQFVRSRCLAVLACLIGTVGITAHVHAAEPSIQQLPGPDGKAAITCVVYEPQPIPEGKAGLIVHLYGSGGSHRKNEYNIGREPYATCRKLLAERGYWLVVADLGRYHWMNEKACTQLDAVIDAMITDKNIDPKQVHLFGTSMGASSSLIYTMRRPERIKSVVAVFPITDFTKWLVEKPNYRVPVEKAHGITPETRNEALAKLSPLMNVDAFQKVPVMLLHGDKDRVVPTHHSRDFAAALQKKGYPFIFHEVPGATHNDKIARTYQHELADFLTEGIQPAEPVSTPQKKQ